MIDINHMQDISNHMEDISNKLISEIRNQEKELFETALRTMADPPIKGEITKGKLKWRGIRLVRQSVGFNFYSWIEQRGKRISPKFLVEHIIYKP